MKKCHTCEKKFKKLYDFPELFIGNICEKCWKQNKKVLRDIRSGKLKTDLTNCTSQYWQYYGNDRI